MRFVVSLENKCPLRLSAPASVSPASAVLFSLQKQRGFTEMTDLIKSITENETVPDFSEESSDEEEVNIYGGNYSLYKT